MKFYSLCFNFGLGSKMLIYDNFDKYLRTFAELTAAIRPGFGVDTYTLRAEDEEAAYKEARIYYNTNGWEL